MNGVDSLGTCRSVTAHNPRCGTCRVTTQMQNVIFIRVLYLECSRHVKSDMARTNLHIRHTGSPKRSSTSTGNA